MKFSAVLAFLAVSASAVAASPYGSNGHRLARGLPPLPPQKRITPVAGAKRGQPSGTPSSPCNIGAAQCCNSVSNSNDSDTSKLLGLLGLNVPVNVPIGLTCSPINIIGASSDCNQETVCCENNNFNGLINIGCTPINIYL